jgi:hypothetical protein
MKTTIRTYIALSLFTFGISAASAGEALHVTVPFAFTAGSATLPAGDYVVSQQPDGRIVTIGGRHGGAILVTIPNGGSATSTVSGLKFGRTSKGNTLLEVEMEGQPSTVLPHKP